MKSPRTPNPAHVLDGGTPLQPNSERRCPAASDVRRSPVAGFHAGQFVLYRQREGTSLLGKRRSASPVNGVEPAKPPGVGRVFGMGAGGSMDNLNTTWSGIKGPLPENPAVDSANNPANRRRAPKVMASPVAPPLAGQLD